MASLEGVAGGNIVILAHDENQEIVVNPFAVIEGLRRIFQNTFPNINCEVRNVSEGEALVAGKLFQAYSDILVDFCFEDDEELNISELTEANTDLTDSIDESDSDLDVDDSQSSWEPTTSQLSPSVKPKVFPNSAVSMDRKKEIVQLWTEHPKWKLGSLQKNGAKELKSFRTLYQWKKQVSRGKTKTEVYRDIDAHVFAQVVEARSNCKIIRASHLRHWALDKFLAYPETGLKFKASTSWQVRFKRCHKISSRKITRLVNKNQIKSADEIATAASTFQQQMKILIPTFPANLVFNTDQCGFQYELLSERTLTFKGEKIVLGFAQSPTNLATHSYTVQYVINVAGDVFPQVYLCLQEAAGKLGPNVKRDIEAFCPKNICLTCSTSGKLSTSLTEYFLRNMVAANMNRDDNFLWIVNSWSGHTNITTYNSVFGVTNDRPECNVQIIPKKCTPICQPLDTTFHRQLKVLAREILAALEVLECSITLNVQDNWTNRKGIIKLQSLLHHQLSAPIFKPMIRYSWYSSGLIQEKEPFLNVKQVCFNFQNDETLTCEMFDCTKQRFIKCARCRKLVCLHHLWMENHVTFCEETPF